ncbi:sulfite exporter TauE/SafE family protein [Endothiovibrio diazotrophicus]
MLESLTISQWGAVAAILFAAYFVRGIAGFGSALVAVPLLALLLPLIVVVPVVVLLDYLGSVGHGFGNRHHIQWRELWPLLPFTLVGIVVALYLLHRVEPGLLTSALGGFVIAYALYSLLPLPELRGSRVWSIPAGFLAGLVGTLFATGGPFTVIYLTIRGLEKAAFRGTIATVFLLDGGMRLVGFAVSGLYARDALLLSLAGLPAVAAGLYVGGHVHTTLSRGAFVRIVAVVLLGSGVALLVK